MKAYVNAELSLRGGNSATANVVGVVQKTSLPSAVADLVDDLIPVSVMSYVRDFYCEQPMDRDLLVSSLSA